MNTFFEATKLDQILKLNLADNLFLDQVEKKSFDEEEFFSSLKKNANFDFIIKISNKSNTFENICKKEKYHPLWDEHYSLFGLLLSAGESKPILFNTHEGISSYELLKGAYFYHLSQQERKEKKKSFLYGELLLLQQAIKFNSIHAIQEYNNYIYEQVATNNSLSKEERINLLKKAISLCKDIKTLELYGSYAYMLLSESYYRYAVFSLDINDLEASKKAIAAASKSCELASFYLELSKLATHNASLGNGLKRSNSFEISDPETAKQLIEDWFKEQSHSQNSQKQSFS